MFTLSITRTRLRPYGLAPRASGPGAAAGPMTRFVAALGRKLAARRAARHLMELDDRMLRDIGLARVDIARAVSGGRD